MGQLLEKYREYGRDILKKRPSTLDREEYSRRHILCILGEKTPLSGITTGEIHRYQSVRLAEGTSSSSIRQELAMISRMFRVANGAWDLTIENPLVNIDRVPPDPGRTRFLATEEAGIVLAEARNSNNKKFYKVHQVFIIGPIREFACLGVNSND